MHKSMLCQSNGISPLVAHAFTPCLRCPIVWRLGKYKSEKQHRRGMDSKPQDRRKYVHPGFHILDAGRGWGAE